MPDGGFKAVIIRILTGLEKRMEDISETLTTEIKELKKNQRCRVQSVRLETHQRQRTAGWKKRNRL